MYLIHQRFRALLVVILTIVLVTVSGAAAFPVQDDPPDPQPDPPWLTSIYYGAVPPENPNGPVLVFVHGYGGTADDWWTPTPFDELNDMYLAAYQAGYRTAFVSLGGSNGRDTGSMWENGQRLSWQLSVIASHYEVDSLDIVAHSKGGIDAQAAVVHYSGWKLVRRVFTLGSPHQGSELADLAYSDWASWLARLVGLQNEATYTLQTGYMQLFRALTDPKVAVQNVIYYRAAGTDTGPAFSGLWLSGLYLSQFGPNDGAVTVASTELSGARTIFIQPFHHYNLFLGHTAFPWIDTALHDPDWLGIGHYKVYLPLVATAGPSGPGSQRIIRGGKIAGTTTMTVPIESGATKVIFDLMLPNNTITVTLTAPDALTRPLEVIPPSDDGSLFGRFWHLVRVEDNPLPGEWVFIMDSPAEAAYLLIAVVESPVEATLSGWPDKAMRPGAPLSLEVQVSHPAGQPRITGIEGRVTRALPVGGQGDRETRRQGEGERGRSHLVTPSPCHPLSGAPLHPCSLALPNQEGIYTVSVTVTGEMPDGTPFERSFVRSVAAMPDAYRD